MMGNAFFGSFDRLFLAGTFVDGVFSLGATFSKATPICSSSSHSRRHLPPSRAV